MIVGKRKDSPLRSTQSSKKSKTLKPSRPKDRKVKSQQKSKLTSSRSGVVKLRGVKLPEPLPFEKVYKECDTDIFKFATTAKIGESHEFISQDRAVRAINMGLGIRKPGYNIYVAGAQGTGKTSVIKTFLERWSKTSDVPQDWIYVYNFQHTEVPRAISLPPGEAKKFKKGMDYLVKGLRAEIPMALQSEDYENAVNAYLSASSDRKAKLFSDLEKRAKSLDFQVKSTRMGIETVPVVEGRVLSEKEYAKLSDELRESIEDKRAQIEPEVLDFARKVRAIDSETREYVEKLRSELGRHVVNVHMDPLLEEYKSNKGIVDYLEQVRDHVLEHLMEFVESDEGPSGAAQSQQEQLDMLGLHEERDRFVRYHVNVFVDNGTNQGAPVIIETNPTYYNLFGKIEKNVEHGMYLTDFTMIKAGAIHRANGGYLVLNAMDIFKTGSIWDTLKRVLKNRLGFIEDMGEQYSLLPTSGLRPAPIPLDLKVILIGNDEIYHLLHSGDEDFSKIFKIKAHFDEKMYRHKSNIEHYVDFIATRSDKEDLLSFDRTGVAAVVEYGSRLVDDQRHLSTQFGTLKDLTIEADYVAREQNSKVIKRSHVEEALDQRFYRVNLVEEQMEEMVKQEDLLLSIEGERIGQVNGLAVYDMGDYSFGKVSRITCTVSMSNEGVFNIERAAKMSGRIHDKGVHILSGFLSALLAKQHHMGIAASVCFEQSYGLIDGDSASITELTAIVSALARLPIKQNLAMTGSLNQFGEVQPIGGVNEKIEGFWRTVELLGKKAETYKVLIPIQNAPNLMVHKKVRQAVKDGLLEIIPVVSFAQVFELATGVPFGVEDIYEERFSEGSALWIIEQRLKEIRESKKRERQKSK
ncbi:MAG: ATP-binding protein [Proteobacteria bacterium]|nr:ATP-binding protein [Pseudomonadota bacterium]